MLQLNKNPHYLFFCFCFSSLFLTSNTIIGSAPSTTKHRHKKIFQRSISNPSAAKFRKNTIYKRNPNKLEKKIITLIVIVIVVVVVVCGITVMLRNPLKDFAFTDVGIIYKPLFNKDFDFKEDSSKDNKNEKKDDNNEKENKEDNNSENKKEEKKSVKLLMDLIQDSYNQTDDNEEDDNEKCFFCSDQHVKSSRDIVISCRGTQNKKPSETIHYLCLTDTYQLVKGKPECPICRKSYDPAFCKAIKTLCETKQGKELIKKFGITFNPPENISDTTPQSDTKK